MKRYAAHYVYCSPQRIIPKGVVEVDEFGIIIRFFSLIDFPEEIHSTEFYNGAIIPFLFDKEGIENLLNKQTFPSLEMLSTQKSLCLKEGEPAHLQLLEELDLINGLILPQTQLSTLV
jgi:hypothetical protein